MARNAEPRVMPRAAPAGSPAHNPRIANGRCHRRAPRAPVSPRLRRWHRSDPVPHHHATTHRPCRSPATAFRDPILAPAARRVNAGLRTPRTPPGTPRTVTPDCTRRAIACSCCPVTARFHRIDQTHRPRGPRRAMHDGGEHAGQNRASRCTSSNQAVPAAARRNLKWRNASRVQSAGTGTAPAIAVAAVGRANGYHATTNAPAPGRSAAVCSGGTARHDSPVPDFAFRGGIEIVLPRVSRADGIERIRIRHFDRAHRIHP